ncbi:MAG: nucleotidyltransferase family protein [Acidobacteria bacterium]|nr:nucleotidyltransferase family protein [Acidobacteriota bacterium]
MRGLLLAAGLGTRLRPLTDRTPKCLVPVRGRPLLDYWLRLLTEAGVGPLLVNTHHHADQVEAFLSAHPLRASVQTVHEPELLGTGGTVLGNRAFLEGGTCMVIHADNLSRFDVAAFIDTHEQRPRGCLATMLTFETDAPESCGIVEVDARGIVRAFEEKPRQPRSRLANGAVYLFEPEVLDLLAGFGPRPDLSTELIPALVGRMGTYLNDVYHRDIGSPPSYAQAQIDDRYLAPEA